jgi:hypothetical protein
VFGQKPRDVNIYFEKRVKLASSNQGFIDLFWPGTLLVEQKSQGRNLAKARAQARGNVCAYLTTSSKLIVSELQQGLE